MAPGFWPDFLSNLFATLIGVIVGVPIGLWLNRRELAVAEEQRKTTTRTELAHTLDVLRFALEANRPRLQRLAQVISQNQALYDTGLDASAWDAVKPFLTSDIGDPAVRQRLAYHFSRLDSVRRLSDVLVRYAVGIESALEGAEQVRQQLRSLIAPAATELDREAAELAGQLQQAKATLIAAETAGANRLTSA